MKTVGDALDAGVTWDQFADAEWDGAPSFASAEEAEAHRSDPLRSGPTAANLYASPCGGCGSPGPAGEACG